MTKFELIGHCPLVGIKGKYNVTGKILLLPVAGDSDGVVKFCKYLSTLADKFHKLTLLIFQTTLSLT